MIGNCLMANRYVWPCYSSMVGNTLWVSTLRLPPNQDQRLCYGTLVTSTAATCPIAAVTLLPLWAKHNAEWIIMVGHWTFVVQLVAIADHIISANHLLYSHTHYRALYNVTTSV